jgi:tRNA U34 5-carboxymethylaminomethyl modifying enzyme MnmG/GidA
MPGFLRDLDELEITWESANDNVRSPGEFSSGLSREVRDKLERVYLSTLGQASRIPGVTPAAIAILDFYLGLPRV